MRYFIILSLLLYSCAVGPNFTSPTLDLPQKIGCDTLPRGLTPDTLSTKWWEKFGDPYLDTLVNKAITQNKDLKIATQNIEIANLRYRNSRSALAPSFGVSGQAQANYNHAEKIVQTYSLTPTMSWEIDIFGGGRRASEGAKASSISTIYDYNGALVAVIASLTENYFSLLEYKVLLEISRKSYATRLKSHELMAKKFEYGAISKVDLNQSKTLLLSAQIAVDGYRTAISEVSTAISVLIGENPRCFDVSSFQLFNIKTPPLPPKILPVWVVDNRPDILSAYYRVWASSAAIGVAVSRRFPTISLTADGGVLYEMVKGTTTSIPFVWNSAFSIAQSLFNFGINKRNVEISRISNKIEILTFEKTVLTAFSEVENAISQIGSLSEQSKKYDELVSSTFSINSMTNELYNKGSVDYLSVLDAERSLFQAQTQYATTLTQKLIAYISLYKAIGGAW